MAITVSADYLCIFAMLKTSPLVYTVGLSLAIPFAVVTEFWRKTTVHATVIVGAIVVAASFVIIGLDNSRKLPDENKNEIEMVVTRDEHWRTP
jgi:solute carrier family 35 protein F5